jgi:hypothetical protein
VYNLDIVMNNEPIIFSDDQNDGNRKQGSNKAGVVVYKHTQICGIK